MICLDYLLRTSINLTKEIFSLEKNKTKQEADDIPWKLTDAYEADDLVLLANTPAKSLLHNP